MKNFKVRPAILIALFLVLFTVPKANAQFVVAEVIKLTVKKVIKAIDLKVQRMQNKTIWLQNAQKVLENELSKVKLTEISGWTEEQKKLYSGYYTELWKIKSTIAYYQRIKDVTLKQAALLGQYKRAWTLFKKDNHFRPEEINYMQKVYSGILDASVQNLDQILLVINSFKTQMSDAERLELINHASDQLDINYNDLQQFNNQNIRICFQRSRDFADTKSIKKMYGIN
jgi:hypothetical protein